MRRQLFVFLVLIGALLVYTSFKLQDSLSTSFWFILPFMLPLFFLMFGGTLLSRTNQQVNEKRWFQTFSSVGPVMIGLWGSYIIFSLISDLLKIILVGGYNLLQIKVIPEDYLNNGFETVSHLTLLAAFAVVIFGFFEVLRGPVVKSVNIFRAQVTAALNNLKIIQISDLHIGASIGHHYVNKVIQKTNQLNPDLIVITGDLVDGKPNTIQEVIDCLAGLKAKYGVYYVTGNHEYYWGIETVLNSLKNTGLQILLNENKTIDINGSKLAIAGVTDPTSRSMHPERAQDISRASKGIESADFKILLAHQPSIYSSAQDLNFDLQLSGHTHAGQFFPFSLFIGLFHKYSRGLYKHKNMHLYVNPGTGFWGPANRFGIPAEITLLNLRNDVN